MTKYLIVLTLCLFHSISFGKPMQVVHLESMELPPFISDKMPDQGAASHALKEIFKKAGYDLQIRIVPILRIRTLQFRDPEVEGFFPAFIDDDFIDGLTLSKSVYETPWVIIERKDRIIPWHNPKDLTKYKGGNVSGYTIRSQVKKMYEENKLNIEGAPDDASNLLKLANRRIDYVFADAHVFKFLMATDPRLKDFQKTLQINQKIVVMNRYGVAFKKDPISKKVMDEFNKQTSNQEFESLVQEYFKKLNSQVTAR